MELVFLCILEAWEFHPQCRGCVGEPDLAAWTTTQWVDLVILLTGFTRISIGNVTKNRQTLVARVVGHMLWQTIQFSPFCLLPTSAKFIKMYGMWSSQTAKIWSGFILSDWPPWGIMRPRAVPKTLWEISCQLASAAPYITSTDTVSLLIKWCATPTRTSATKWAHQCW